MYAYIHIYIYVHVCMYIYVCVHIYPGRERALIHSDVQFKTHRN